MAAEMSPAQRDIRWFYWRMNAAGVSRPESADAQAFAERVAIMMEAAGLSEADARAEAVKPFLSDATEASCPPPPVPQ
jgi:hypothetical protein